MMEGYVCVRKRERERGWRLGIIAGERLKDKQKKTHGERGGERERERGRDREGGREGGREG